jgi:hypothetical protein
VVQFDYNTGTGRGIGTGERRKQQNNKRTDDKKKKIFGFFTVPLPVQYVPTPVPAFSTGTLTQDISLIT